ncbi:MAG: hypothetical protein WAM94_15820 [Chromatiaceae bacterium]
MPSFTFKLTTLATNDPSPGPFVIQLKPDHKETLAHAIELQGEFSKEVANGYALLNYPPCRHLTELRANRLARFSFLPANQPAILDAIEARRLRQGDQ